MKQPKRLKRDYKEAVSAYHLDADNWMLQKDDETYITIVHKVTGKTKLIDKFARAKNTVWCALLPLLLATFLLFDVSAKDNDTYISSEARQACEEYGEEYSIAPELLMAMIETESSGNPDAENGSCKGLMQVSEKWHKDRMKRLGVTDIFDTKGNILVATDYLYELFEKYEDVCMVLDTYNGNSKAEYNFENGIVSEYAEKVLERSAELERIHGK